MSGEATLKAVSAAIDMLATVAEVTAQLNKISALIQKARAENRDISPDEWAELSSDLADAKARAQAALDRG